jgi:ligand-binding sensor domain-containing protein
VQESSTPTRSEICNHELALEWDLSSRRISWSDYHAATRSTNQFQVYSCLETRTNITGITLDNAGDLWVSTAGQGVFHISGHQPISNAVWAHFDSHTSALASDYVHSIAVDQNNNLLALTDNGIERFDGAHWEQLEVTVLADPATIFVDSQNGTWVGSEMGACQLSGEQCIPIVTNVKVAAFAEAPDGTLWIGTHDGLLQYDLEGRRQTWFDTENSALPGNQVERLYRDSAHGLWIIAMAPWSNTGIPFPLRAFLGFCLFGYLFIHVRRGYKQLKTI